jgi:hypothetical protein
MNGGKNLIIIEMVSILLAAKKMPVILIKIA